jgi:hypothetical protein
MTTAVDVFLKTCALNRREEPRPPIAAAVQLKYTSHTEYVRQALLNAVESDGVKLLRGAVVLAGNMASAPTAN